MSNSFALVETEGAARLIKRLCKHWGHKFPVSFDDQQGSIALGIGDCRLTAVEAGLEVRLQSETTAQLDQLEPVVSEHLQRMTGKETLAIRWERRAGQGSGT